MGLRELLLLFFSVALTLRSLAAAALPGELAGSNPAEPDMTCIAAIVMTHDDMTNATPAGTHDSATHHHAGTCAHLCAMAAALPCANWPHLAVASIAPVTTLPELDSVSTPPPLEPPRRRG